MRLPALVALALLTGCGSTSTSADGGLPTPSNDAALPIDGWVAPARDAGSPSTDAGAPTDGGSTTVADSGTTPAIDSGTPPADSGTTSTPAGTGPFDVSQSMATVGGANVVVFDPALPAGARAPLVMFKHGFQLATSDYATTLTQIASHGYVVVGVDSGGGILGGPSQSDEEDQVRAAIDWATGSASITGHVDADHIAVMGHSRGGKVAVMVAAQDARVSALLALDPVNSCGPGSSYSSTCPDVTSSGWAPSLTIPSGYMGETADGSGGFMPCAPTAQNYATVYDATTAASAALEWTFTDAAHMTFTDDGGGLAGCFCMSASGDQAMIRDSIRTLAVAFLDRYLRGDTSRAPWLTGASLPSDVTLRHR